MEEQHKIQHMKPYMMTLTEIHKEMAYISRLIRDREVRRDDLKRYDELKQEMEDRYI
jgi:hypothetical protein